jgi:hypothetical protein
MARITLPPPLRIRLASPAEASAPLDFTVNRNVLWQKAVGTGLNLGLPGGPSCSAQLHLADMDGNDVAVRIGALDHRDPPSLICDALRQVSLPRIPARL